MKYAKQRTPTRYVTKRTSVHQGLIWTINIYRDGRWEEFEDYISSDADESMKVLADVQSRLNVNGRSNPSR